MDAFRESDSSSVTALAKAEETVRAFLQREILSSHPSIRKISYRKGQLLAHEGDDLGDVWFILQGQVQVFRTTANGRLVTLATLGAGNFTGEMALIEGKERSACILASNSVEAIFIPAEIFRKWISAEISILHALIVQLASRVRNAGQQTFEIAGGSVSQRVAAQLVRMGQRNEQGIVIVTPRPRVTDLAKSVNASREAVSKILNRWIIAGHLDQDGNGLKVNALPELAVPL